LPKKKGTYPKHSSASGVGPVGTPPVAGDPWAQQSSVTGYACDLNSLTRTGTKPRSGHTGSFVCGSGPKG
jgi:hypothetical protein